MTSIKELSIHTSSCCRYFAKIEGENPTGSLKDRMIVYTLKAYERVGVIRPGNTIVEASSGNTGIALAYFGIKLGYQITIFVDARISDFKKNQIRQLGATLLEIDCTRNPEANIELAQEISTGKNTFWFNQFGNPFHVQAYYETLGKETLEQLKFLSVRIDYLVAGLGSGGSILGLGHKLRETHNSEIKIFAVSPSQSPTSIEGLHPGHIRGDFPLWKLRESGFEEGRIFINDRDAITEAINLEKNESLSVGPCSGAVLYAALKKISLPGNYLLLFSDSGNRYRKLYQDFRYNNTKVNL
jgi:cysteine synthase